VIKNRFSKPEDNKRTVCLIYISRGQQKHRRTTQKLFIPVDLPVKMLRTEREKYSTLLVSFNMQRISIVLPSQQSLLTARPPNK